MLELLTGGRNVNLEAFLAEQAQIMAGLQGGGGGGGNGDGVGAEVNFDEILQALRGDGGDDNQVRARACERGVMCVCVCACVCVCVCAFVAGDQTMIRQ